MRIRLLTITLLFITVCRVLAQTNYAVGTIAGSFAVSPSGAATYTVPIEVPAGVAGVQPSISISYNSQGGNGLLGIGWNLSVVSAISVTGADFYHDGYADGVKFDGNDKLTWDGQRLINDNGTLKTETETFTTIVPYSGGYKITTKDNTVLYYGIDAESRSYLPGTTKIMAWYLKQSVDVAGNDINYHYISDNGEFLLSYIDYTRDNFKSYNEPNKYNKIVFDYDVRPDILTTYLNGSVITNTKRLCKITCYSNDALFCRYSFWYNIGFNYVVPYNIERLTDFSRLMEIRRLASDGTEVTPTSIKWNITTELSTPTTIPLLSNLYDFSIKYTGDFNGDGITDIITIPNKVYPNFTTSDTWTLYLGHKDGTFSYFTSGSLNNQFVDFTVTDSDNDGVDDLLWHYKTSGSVDYCTYVECSTTSPLTVSVNQSELSQNSLKKDSINDNKYKHDFILKVFKAKSIDEILKDKKVEKTKHNDTILLSMVAQQPPSCPYQVCTSYTYYYNIFKSYKFNSTSLVPTNNDITFSNQQMTLDLM